jgi:farnesyl-diphosphate farnesyltransferase
VHSDQQPGNGPETDLDDLLERTSRTFALTIPLLPDPTRRAVMLAYLLFRIADTFEDATAWTAEERLAALADFARMLDGDEGVSPREVAARWVASPPVSHEGYVDLLARTPEVLDAFGALDAPSREVVHAHVLRTIRGMSGFVQRTGARPLQLRDMRDLRDYCYAVAGIVGEMLTELYVLHHPEVAPAAPRLRARAAEFGEGLQLTNILKDSRTDATEGRRFLPADLPRDAVFDLARRDLDRAEEYVDALHAAGAPRGLLAFNALPQLLARATLDRVSRDGPGAKLSRTEVFEIVERMDRALDDGATSVGSPSAHPAPR